MGPRPQRKSVEPAAYLIASMGVPARFPRRWRSGPVDPRAGPGEGGDGLAFAGLTATARSSWGRRVADRDEATHESRTGGDTVTNLEGWKNKSTGTG
jgi:hypothetical protein